jgi:hypothetical protein
LHVFVDGNLLHTGKLGSAPRKLASMTFTVGSASYQGPTADAPMPGWVWRAGQLWVLEDDLNETQIATSYCLGPAYKGNHYHHCPSLILVRHSTKPSLNNLQVFSDLLWRRICPRRCSSRRPISQAA